MLIVLLLALGIAPETPPSRLAVIRPAPAFTLLDTAGKQVAAGRAVRDKREAEWLAATIMKAIAPR